MRIFPADASHIDVWLEMREALWPDCRGDESRQEIVAMLSSPRETAFIAVDESGRAVGFAEASLREYVDGCSTRPVGYLEGIYVAPPFRHRGIGRALAKAAEDWAASRGCREMGSDTQITNTDSIAFHQAAGFHETERQIVFLKRIGDWKAESRPSRASAGEK